MAASFQDYFRHSHAKGSITATHREQSIFAVIFVHEVAHTYSYWLRYPRRLAWGRWEKKAELGCSWEYNVIGRAVQSLRHANGASYAVHDVRIVHYEIKKQRDRAASSLVGNRIAEYYKVERKEPWPVLDPSGHRFPGVELYLDQTCDHYIAVLNAIPMAWIISCILVPRESME